MNDTTTLNKQLTERTMKTMMTLALCALVGMATAGNGIEINKKYNKKGGSNISALHVNGMVNGMASEGSVVVVYEGNEEVARFETPHNGKFALDLSTNNYYTIEVAHEGFVAKRIGVDTHLPENANHSMPFNFEVELFQNDMFLGVDKDVMDFPVAVVRYDVEIDEFNFNGYYAANMQIEHQKLMLEAELRKKYRLY